MTSDLRSRDLDWLASEVENHYRASGYKVTRDQPLWDDAPVVAIRAQKGSEDLLLELRQKPDLPNYLHTFVHQAIAREEPAALAVAVAGTDGEDDDPAQSVSFAELRRLRALGVGLIEVGSEGVVVIERAVPFSARTVVPRKLRGDATIADIAAKFNRGDSLDAVRDLVVHVEGVVTDIAARAAKRGVINCTEPELLAMHDLSNVIDMLATPNYRTRPQHRVIPIDLKTDLHSFRTARNLAQHAPRNRQQRQRRDRQLKERMDNGFRLCEELAAIKVPSRRP